MKRLQVRPGASIGKGGVGAVTGRMYYPDANGVFAGPLHPDDVQALCDGGIATWFGEGVPADGYISKDAAPHGYGATVAAAPSAPAPRMLPSLSLRSDSLKGETFGVATGEMYFADATGMINMPMAYADARVLLETGSAVWITDPPDDFDAPDSVAATVQPSAAEPKPAQGEGVGRTIDNLLEYALGVMDQHADEEDTGIAKALLADLDDVLGEEALAMRRNLTERPVDALRALEGFRGLVPEDDDEEEEAVEQMTDEERLAEAFRMKSAHSKADLQALCEEHGHDYDDKDNKAALVGKLLGLDDGWAKA